MQSLEVWVAASGQPIVTPDGDRRLGGHSFRVEGAQFLASLGIEVLVIMCLARWQSQVVLRYIREAPLAALTDTYKTLARRAAVKEGSDTISDLAGKIEELSGLVSQHQEQVRRLAGDLRTEMEQSAALVPVLPPPPDMSSVIYVNGKIHKVSVAE